MALSYTKVSWEALEKVLEPRRAIVVLVGLPGTGKSTFRKQLAVDGLKFITISSDDLIDEYAKSVGKTYTEVFKEAVGSATKQIERDAVAASACGESVVWDQTNLTAGKRKQILDKFQNYVKICVTFEIPDEVEWLKRLYRRAGEEGKYIPYHVMRSMAKSYEPPMITEGFDLIISDKEYGSIFKASSVG